MPVMPIPQAPAAENSHEATVPPQAVTIEEQIAALPTSAGVYLHQDAAGRVLYVGKAKNLRNRVRSYFQPSANHSIYIAAMVRSVRKFEIFQTHTEAEALLLEANLIKKHKPRYNINLKDDKSYPFFKLTVHEPYPRLFLVREKLERGAEYFGPYASVKDARETLKVVHRVFKLRTSKMKLDGSKTYRPCINYQLRKCQAPCRGDVATEDYHQVVRQVRLFLAGRYAQVLGRFEREMQAAAEEQNYEEAARLRDDIRAICRTMERQRALVPDLRADQDVFGLCRESHFAAMQVLFIRGGRLIGSDCVCLEGTEGRDDAEIVKSVLSRIYTRRSALPPREIMIPTPYEDQQVLAAFLSKEKGSTVRIVVPRKGEKRRLVELATENAHHALRERMANQVNDEHLLAEVRRRLHLRHVPERVEAFDISNISGSHTVASMVVWHRNQADKEAYRKFQLRTISGPDDFQAMEEVLTRRYRRTAAGEQTLPDLILIDGGKGQVNRAAQVLHDLGISLTQVDVIGLAKGRSERRAQHHTQRDPKTNRRQVDFEYVVKPQAKHELRLERNSATLHFLQRIRDEAHRFAVSYHRKLRSRKTLRSSLDDLPGVGVTRRQVLLRHFGSLKGVREADLDALKAVPGIPAKVAETIFHAYAPAPAETPSISPR